MRRGVDPFLIRSLSVSQPVTIPLWLDSFQAERLAFQREHRDQEPWASMLGVVRGGDPRQSSPSARIQSTARASVSSGVYAGS